MVVLEVCGSRVMMTLHFCVTLIWNRAAARAAGRPAIAWPRTFASGVRTCGARSILMKFRDWLALGDGAVDFAFAELGRVMALEVTAGKLCLSQRSFSDATVRGRLVVLSQVIMIELTRVAPQEVVERQLLVEAWAWRVAEQAPG